MLRWGKHDILYEQDMNIQASILEKQIRKHFLEVVIVARQNIYHASLYKSNVELKSLLQKDVGISKMFYKFYHHEKLENSPNVSKGIEERSSDFRSIILLAASK